MANIEIPVNELTEFDLPRMCLVSGRTDEVVFKDVKFSWYPRWVSAFVIINLLIAAILASVLTRRVKGQLPFREEHFRAWRRGRIFFGLAVFIGLITGLCGFMLLFVDPLKAALGGVVLLGSIVAPWAIHRRFLRPFNVVCQEISKTHVRLRIPNMEAALAIKAHLSGRQQAIPRPSAAPRVRAIAR